MLTYTRLKSKARIFQNFTGLTLAAFAHLLPAFERVYEQVLQERERKRTAPRQRQAGGGRRPMLRSAEDKLLFILFYFKFYPTQEVQGYFFGLSQAQANVWIHTLTPLLNRALGSEQQLPVRKAASIEEVLAACPGLEFIIDGTERPIQRPHDQKRQRQYYSGKKKRHTVKNIVISEKRTKKIRGLSRTCEGKKHDKALADDEGYTFPSGSTLWQDTGFQGYEPPNVLIYQPKKKPKGGTLTPDERAHNQAISRIRIGVEHSLGGVKSYRIVHDTYRNHRHGFDDLVIVTACGLHNLRCDYRLAA